MSNDQLRFAIIGHPLPTFTAPQKYADFLVANGYAASIDRMDVAKTKLGETIRNLADNGFCGFAVEMPHRVNVLEYLDEVDTTALRYGCVNAVKIWNGRTRGYNTEVEAFVEDTKEKGLSCKGKRALIIGAGALGRALAIGMMEAGAADVTIANRTEKDGVLQIDSPLCRELARRIDYIVNATPLGYAKEDPCCIAKGIFTCNQIIYDCTPSTAQNGTYREAFVARAQYSNGVGMQEKSIQKALQIIVG